MNRTIFHSLSLVTIIGASLALPLLADAQTTPAPQSPPNAQMAPSSQQPLVNPSTPNPNPTGLCLIRTAQTVQVQEPHRIAGTAPMGASTPPRLSEIFASRFFAGDRRIGMLGRRRKLAARQWVCPILKGQSV